MSRQVSIFRNSKGRSLNRGDHIIHITGSDRLIVVGWTDEGKLYAGWNNRLMEIPETDLKNWGVEFEKLKIEEAMR